MWSPITYVLSRFFFAAQTAKRGGSLNIGTKVATLCCSPEKYLSHVTRNGKLIIAYIELCSTFTQGGVERTDTSCCHTIIANVSVGSMSPFIRIQCFNKWHKQLNCCELRLLSRVTNYYIGRICLQERMLLHTRQSSNTIQTNTATCR